MRPDSPLAHTKHVIRAAVLLCLGIIALVLGRSFFIPETWGQYGSYRGADVADRMNFPVLHGGNESCGSCHEEEQEVVAEAGHRSLACELCHAPLSVHVQDDDTVGEMPIHKTAELCIGCHEALDARPADFPQVHPRQHVKENGEEFTNTVCFECHEAHSPL